MTPSSPPQSAYPIIGGVLHAPYFIFLRGAPMPTNDVLDLLWPPRRSSWQGVLGGRGCKRLPLPCAAPPHGVHVYVGTLAGWYLIADDWSYSLWHREDRQELLNKLAAQWELFALLRPDVDESYEFVHYIQGRRVRERRVESPRYTDRVVTLDFGTPFPCEGADLYEQDGDEIVWTVAGAVGVPRVHNRRALRRYGKR